MSILMPRAVRSAANEDLTMDEIQLLWQHKPWVDGWLAGAASKGDRVSDDLVKYLGNKQETGDKLDLASSPKVLKSVKLKSTDDYTVELYVTQYDMSYLERFCSLFGWTQNGPVKETPNAKAGFTEIVEEGQTSPTYASYRAWTRSDPRYHEIQSHRTKNQQPKNGYDKVGIYKAVLESKLVPGLVIEGHLTVIWIRKLAGKDETRGEGEAAFDAFCLKEHWTRKGDVEEDDEDNINQWRTISPIKGPIHYDYTPWTQASGTAHKRSY
jgi:hypothetical protein